MEWFKSFVTYLKRNLDIVIMIVPNNGTKVRRFRSETVLIVLVFYTVGILWGGFYISSVAVKTEKTMMTEEDIGRINDLREKVMELSGELEGLKESNRKLKNTMIQADSTSLYPKKVSAVKKNIPKEGNLYKIIREIFTNLKEFQQESYYFIKPAEGFISRRFNPEKGHFGIDIALRNGSAVFAAGNGYVSFAGYTPEDGYIIMVNHSDEFVTLYKHCSVLLKKQRDFVAQGELIALSGDTGKSTGPHLHFEIWKKGVPGNPEDYLINLIKEK
jgi:murein DD-endopeptidase MepM/ murein hydrolase activator NlpD